GFNAAGQKDADGVIGSDEAPIRFAGGSAWLKYSVQAMARATANLDAGSAAGQIQAAEQVRLCDYRRHDIAEPVALAIPRGIEPSSAVRSSATPVRPSASRPRSRPPSRKSSRRR